jgi:hypothetical protein
VSRAFLCRAESHYLSDVIDGVGKRRGATERRQHDHGRADDRRTRRPRLDNAWAARERVVRATGRRHGERRQCDYNRAESGRRSTAAWKEGLHENLNSERTREQRLAARRAGMVGGAPTHSDSKLIRSPNELR